MDWQHNILGSYQGYQRTESYWHYIVQRKPLYPKRTSIGMMYCTHSSKKDNHLEYSSVTTTSKENFQVWHCLHHLSIKFVSLIKKMVILFFGKDLQKTWNMSLLLFSYLSTMHPFWMVANISIPMLYFMQSLNWMPSQ